MGKIQTNIRGSQFDPFSKEDQVAKIFGGEDSNGQPAETPVLNPNSNVNTLSSIDLPEDQKFSLLGNDQLAKSTIDETIASQQSIVDLTGKFLWNVGSTVLTEIGKVPGYIIGAGGAVANEALGDGKNSMSMMVDNAWINAFEGLDENIKSVFPVHLNKDVQEGDLLNKMGSGQWWASTGADGVGFLLSMFLPGQAAKLLGVGSEVAKVGELLGNAAPRLGKSMTKAGLLKQLAGESKFVFTDKFANGANGAFSAVLNSSLESAAEAANTFDNVKTKFIKEGYSEEDATSLAGNRAAAVFKANLPLLLVSNLIDEAWIWKSFGTGQKSAANNILSKIVGADGKIDIEAVKALQKKGFKEGAIDSVIGFGEGILKEGFLEEGTQTLLQQQIEEKGSAGTGLENLGRVASEYLDELLTNPEMQESIALGGLLGGGMSLIGTVSNTKNYNRQLFGSEEYSPKGILQRMFTNARKATPGLIKTFTENYISLTKSMADVYERNEDGTIKTNEEGKPIVNEEQYAKLLDDKKTLLEANQKYDIALAKGDFVEAEQLGNALMFNYVLPFIQQEGGYELLKDHINNQVVPAWAERFQKNTGREATAEEVKDYQEKFLEKAKNINDVYSTVDSTNMPERYFVSDDPVYKEWKKELFKQKFSLLLDYRTYDKVLKDIESKESKIGVSLDGKLDPEALKNLDPEQVRQIQFFAPLKKLVKAKKDKASADYLSLFNKEGLSESFNIYSKFKSEVAKNAIKEAEKQSKEAVSLTEGNKKNTELSQAIINAGYDAQAVDSVNVDESGNPIQRTIISPDEIVHLKSTDGKRYVALTKEDKTVLFDSKGASQPLTSGLINKLGLSVIPKDQVQLENKAYKLQKRKNIQLSLISDLLNYNKQRANQTEEEIKEINAKLEQNQEELSKFKKQLNEDNKTTRSEVEQRLKEIEYIINELTDRKNYLEGLKLRYTTLITEYSRLEEEIKQTESPISLSQRKQDIENTILDKITNLEEDVDLTGTIAEAAQQVNSMSSLIESLTNSILKATRIRDELQKFLDNDTAFKTILLSEYLQQQDFIRRVSELVPNYPGIQSYVSRKLKDNKLLDLLRDSDFKTGILRRLRNGDENYLQKFNEVFDRLESLSQLNTEVKLQAEERYAAEQALLVTNQELEDLNKELSNLKPKLELFELNKQFLVLKQATSKKVEEEFKRRVYKDSIQDNQVDKTGFEEPLSKDVTLHDEFLTHQLGTETFITTGLSVVYDKEGKFKGKDSLNEEGLPVLNSSIYQRVWFNVIDKIARAKDISNYRLMLYSPDYTAENKSQLQVQIELNNPTDKRSDRDLFVVLTDQAGNPVYSDDAGNFVQSGTAVFTSLWRPETLYPAGSNPRLAPDAVLKTYFANLKLATRPSWSRLSELSIDQVFRSVKDKEVLSKELGVQFNKEDILQAAISYNRELYTKWYNSALKSNGALLEPVDITAGRPVVKRDVNTRELKWNNVLSNIEGLRLVPKTFGAKQLEGAKLIVSTDGQVKKGEFVKNVPKGEVILQLNSGEITSLQQRHITDSETELVLYLLSLGIQAKNAPADSITIDLPEGVYYKVNDAEIKGRVPVLYSLDKRYKNFSLIHTIIAYGRKREGLKKSGEIFVATNRQEVIYTTFEGETRSIGLDEINQSIRTGEFTEETKKLVDFLKTKRFNVSQNMINQNGVFPYPKLKKKRNTKGEYEYSVEFDTRKSYYQFLLEGDNAVLQTSLFKAKGYPQFVQRNVVFNPNIITPNIEDRPTIKPEPSEIPSPKSKTEDTSFVYQKQLDQIDAKLNALNTQEELDAYRTRIDTNLDLLDKEDPNVIRFANEVNLLFNARIAAITPTLENIPAANSFMNMNFGAATEQLGFGEMDKILLPEDMLRNKIENGEIKQKCQ